MKRSIRMSRKPGIAGLGVVEFATAVFIVAVLAIGLLLASNNTTAEEVVVSDVAVSVPVSCNMTGNLDAAHSATINPGTYQDEIGTTTMQVFCNDNTGFAVYAVGYSNSEHGNNKLIATVAGELSPTNDIATGTATSGNTSAWAMKLTPVTGDYTPAIENGYSNYSNVPNAWTKVATRTTNTDFTIGSSIKSTYAAYIDGLKPAGTYAGKVKYTLVHPNTGSTPPAPQPSASGKICYYANATDAVGTMGCQDVASSVDLLAPNFSRSGYGFAGWSDAFDYDTNTNAHFYGPQETITLTPADYQSPNSGLSLYAVWVKSAGNIQSWNGCSSLTPANTATNILKQSITALSDARDDNTYAVARLADGNCWMIENLRLENTNSDNSTGSLAQGYGTSTTYGNFSGLANAESTGFTGTYTANSLYYSGTQEGTASIDIGTSNYPAYRMPCYNNLNTTNRAQNNPNSNTFSNNNTTGGMYSYGNYYTWHAAIADTTYYSSGDHNTTSICPTGWQPPLGNTSTGDIEQGTADAANKVGGFSYLDRKMGGTGAYQSTAADSLRWRKFPVNFLYSGRFNTSSAHNRGSYGYYWSSTARNNYYSYQLYLNSASVDPGTSNGTKYYGLSIRCTVSAGT